MNLADSGRLLCHYDLITNMKAIITFHSIDNKSSVISYSPRLFSSLLNILADRNIPICDLETLLKPEVDAGVVLTFDDGMKSVFTHALPVLRDYGASAHIFITTDAINNDRQWPNGHENVPCYDMLDWHEIEQLHDAGIYIESHTQTHPDMREISMMRIEDECGSADRLISGRLGRTPQYFAYPFGYHNANTREFARRNYKACVTTELRTLGKKEDNAVLPRLDSYYFRSNFILKRLDDFTIKSYLSARWFLRTLKGSHCLPDAE